MSKDLREIAQREAEMWIGNYDFINIAEKQAELDLTDDELEEVWEMVTDATVEVYRVL